MIAPGRHRDARLRAEPPGRRDRQAGGLPRAHAGAISTRWAASCFSQRVLLALTQKGMSREDAYAAVQRNAMEAWRGKASFLACCRADKEIGAVPVRRRARSPVRPGLSHQARRHDLQAGVGPEARPSSSRPERRRREGRDLSSTGEPAIRGEKVSPSRLATLGSGRDDEVSRQKPHRPQGERGKGPSRGPSLMMSAAMKGRTAR